jgi:hypothetical protein
MAYIYGLTDGTRRGRPPRRHRLLWLAAVTLLLPGCGIGPPMLERDRLDYQTALSESWKRQMLMNLVRTRYADAPVFLETTSIINQYSAEAEVSALGVLNNPPWSSSQEYNGIARYYDRPTVTYVPLTGERFARSLLSPVPPASLISLVQSGWPVDFVFRLTCEAINGVRNRSSGQLQSQVADPRFEELLAAMRRVQLADTIGLRLERKDGKETTVVFFGRSPAEAVMADMARIREILGLDAQAREFHLVFGGIASGGAELAILSRSMMQLMVELGTCINVPEEHLARGMTFRPPTGPQETRLMEIRSARFKPGKAFVAVPYQDHWYWIEEGDFRSKRILSLLMMFFSMTESGGGAGAPIVTVNAG